LEQLYVALVVLRVGMGSSRLPKQGAFSNYIKHFEDTQFNPPNTPGTPFGVVFAIGVLCPHYKNCKIPK
jgi:hypothetical protein